MLHFRRFAIVGLLVAACCCSISESSYAAKKKKNVIRRLSFNKSARLVKLFDGIESGELSSRIAVKDEKTSTVYLSNETDQPLTVELPGAVVGVHVLKQFQPLQPNGPFNPQGNAGNGNAGNGNGGNGQTVGGQLGGNQNQNGPGNNGFGNNAIPGGDGFFSIPPEATVALNFDSVCLEHGKPNPTSAMKYELRPVESIAAVSGNAKLVRLLSEFDLRKSNRNAVQAAAWHLANGMTWNQLQSKPRKRLGLPETKWFAKQDLTLAKKLVSKSADLPQHVVDRQPAARR